MPDPTCPTRYMTRNRDLCRGLRRAALALAAALSIGQPIVAQEAPSHGPAQMDRADRATTRAAALGQALRATLRLTDPEDRQLFLGSGFVYGPDPVVVTNAHVSGSRRWLAAHVGAGEDTWVLHLRLRLIDPARDLAIYDVTEPVSLPPLRAADEAPRPGDTLYALGAPLGLAQSLSAGVLSYPARQVEPAVPLAYYQHDAATNPGSSGGPLVNAAGDVVAVNARIADGSRLFNGVAYGIPISLVDKLLAGTLQPVPELGLSLRPLSIQMARLLGHKLPGGVLVEDVTPDTPAARAGVLPGDILLSLAGQELRRPGALAFALDGRHGDSLPLRIYRPGTTPEGQFPKAMELTLSLPAPAPAQTVTSLTRTSPGPMASGLTLDGRAVLKVAEDSPSFLAGLAAGDRIEAVNGEAGPLPDLTLLTGPALLRIARDGRMLHVLLDPAARPSLKRPVTGNALDPDVIPF